MSYNHSWDWGFVDIITVHQFFFIIIINNMGI
jgi:hypothetical protein